MQKLLALHTSTAFSAPYERHNPRRSQKLRLNPEIGAQLQEGHPRLSAATSIPDAERGAALYVV